MFLKLLGCVIRIHDGLALKLLCHPRENAATTLSYISVHEMIKYVDVVVWREQEIAEEDGMIVGRQYKQSSDEGMCLAEGEKMSPEQSVEFLLHMSEAAVTMAVDRSGLHRYPWRHGFQTQPSVPLTAAEPRIGLGEIEGFVWYIGVGYRFRIR